MKKLSHKDLQNVCLDIMKDVHRFCEDNGIVYSLAYGSLLGAVRHKGFIPWDDDVDIVMTRDNYNKFCRLYSSRRYRLVNADTDPDCYIAFSRVCECRRTEARSMYPWHGHGFRTGVWIDVFPLDAVPRAEGEYNRIFRVLNDSYRHSVKVRKMHVGFQDVFNLHSFIRVLGRRLLYRHTGKEDPCDSVRFIGEEVSRIDAGSDFLLAQLCCPDVEEGGYEPGDFCDTVLAEFEDARFRIPRNYDRILTIEYGNYMQLPPEKDRKPHQSSYRAFWLDR